VTLFAKCEFLNPSGSIKDRFAHCVIADAEARGLLRSDSIILECTSGNTGIALAMVGAARGYGVTILMSEAASIERRHLLRRFGAEVILLPSGGTYQTGIDRSREMAAKDSRYFLPRQFENPLNLRDHEDHTGPEILRQAPLPIAAFVAGKGFVPPLLRSAPIDATVKITAEEALQATRRLHREFGLLVGTSSGANIAAALRVARDLPPDATIITLLCDRAKRYFSTPLFAE